MPKFLHAADLHIDSPLQGLDAYDGAPVGRVRGASRRALENLVALALSEQVRFVVIGGDVFDTEPLLESWLFFGRQLRRLADAGIKVAVVRGNHDHAGIAPKNAVLPPGVHVLDHAAPETVELLDGVAVHGRSYPRHDVMEDLVADYPPPRPGVLNVGLLHTSLTGLGPHDPYAPTSVEVLAGLGYQYWALGHVHKRQTWEEQGVPIVFPGNLQGRHIRETGDKGVTLVEYERDRVKKLTHVPVDVMRWHDVQLSATEAGAGGDPVGFAAEQVRRVTSADRGRGLLCAVRVTLETSARGFDEADLRESLISDLQSAGDLLFLEKVRLRSLPKATGASAVEGQLRSLVAAVSADPALRASLGESFDEVRGLLRKADQRLARAADFLPPQNPSEADATRVLSGALDLLLGALGGGRP